MQLADLPRKFLLLQHLIKARSAAMSYIAPNYAYRGPFTPHDVIVDVGVGDNPDLSLHLIAQYGVEAYGVDPTHKHAAILSNFDAANPAFHYLPYALGAEAGECNFYESNCEVSGSLMKGHRNVVQNNTITYPVKVLTLEGLLDQIGHRTIALLKIDIEGAEYALLHAVGLHVVQRCRQVLVEFHHDTVVPYGWKDTVRAVRHLESLGMTSCIYNKRDCLFWWPD